MSNDIGKCVDCILSIVKKKLHIVVNNVRLDLHNIINDTGYLTVHVSKYSEIYQHLIGFICRCALLQHLTIKSVYQ